MDTLDFLYPIILVAGGYASCRVDVFSGGQRKFIPFLVLCAVLCEVSISLLYIYARIMYPVPPASIADLVTTAMGVVLDFISTVALEVCYFVRIKAFLVMDRKLVSDIYSGWTALILILYGSCGVLVILARANLFVSGDLADVYAGVMNGVLGVNHLASHFVLCRYLNMALKFLKIEDVSPWRVNLPIMTSCALAIASISYAIFPIIGYSPMFLIWVFDCIAFLTVNAIIQDRLKEIFKPTTSKLSSSILRQVEKSQNF